MKNVYGSLLFGFFFLVLACDCIFIINDMEEYRFYTKPMLVPILYIIMAMQTAETTHKRTKLYISLGMFFCFSGDFLLLNADNNSYFIWGLSAFLLAQICYGLFFLRIKKFSLKRVTAIILIALIIAAYLCLLLSSLWRNINDQSQAVPVIIYSVAIGFMLLTALHTGTGRRVKKMAWQHFIPGAVLFIVSDSLLAIDKFSTFSDKEFQSDIHLVLAVAVMVTYGGAQALIVSGATRIIRR